MSGGALLPPSRLGAPQIMERHDESEHGLRELQAAYAPEQPSERAAGWVGYGLSVVFQDMVVCGHGVALSTC